MLRTAPVDVTAAASGTSGSLNSGSATTTNTVDLLFAGGVSATVVTGPGTGYVARSTAQGNITEDRTVSAVNSYSATASNQKGAWAMQMVAFKATSGTVDSTPPTTPTGLSMTASTTSSVSLSWAASTDNVGVAGYKIFRAGVQVGTSTTNAYTDTGLAPSTTYSYTVSAYDAAGNNSGQSSVIQATTKGDTTPPTVPTGLSVTGTTASTISLSWNPSTDNFGVAGYKIYRAGLQVGTISATSFTDTGLTPSTAYSYTVSAYDAAGNNSAPSSAVQATTSAQPDTTPPTAPTGLSVTGTTVNTASLSWTASTDNVGVTGYKIYRAGVQVGTTSATSYTDTGLAASTAYSYTVSAYDAAGNTSAPSSAVQATTQPDTTPPTTPTGLSMTASTTSSVSLSWAASTDNVGVAGYKVFRSGAQVGTSGTAAYTDTGLAPSTTYYYTVSAYDAAGNNSAQSTSTSATTAAQTAGVTPTLVQHVATGMDRYPVTNFTLPLPNLAGTGNALILGVQFHSTGAITAVVDNKGNTWVAGPTATNTSASQTMSLYYALNVIGGTQTITVTFSGLGSSNGYPQAVVSEFYNVAQVSAEDGSSGNATSRTAGAITTSSAGDLIYHWGVDFSDTNANGGAYNGSSITAGAGFTLLSADLQVGSADQYQVQSNAGNINPTFTASGSATWGSLALAFKSGSAGTPPPPGIRIVHIQHTLLNSVRAQNRPNPIMMQFPSSGNLLVGLYNSADTLISNVSDSARNTWVSAGSTIGGGGNTQAQIMYAANATTSPTLSGITVALNGATQGDNQFNLYDIAGAATSPFDISSTALGNQTSAGNLTTTTLTPSTANGLVLNQVAIDFHTINGIVGANYMLDTDVNAFDNDDPPNGGTDVSTLDMDNGYAHIYNTTTNPVTFVYTYNQTTSGGVQTWGAVATAFKAASSGIGDTTPPTVPTGLQFSNVTSTSITLSWTASTDNVAVAGYQIFRNGAGVGTTTTTSYTDAEVAASTSYVYTITAYDTSNNVSASSQPLTVTTTSGPVTTPYFVQVNNSEVSSGFGISVTLNTPTVAGNTIVVYVIWNNTGGVAVSDSRGDTFAGVGIPVSWGKGYSAQIFYATGIVGGTDTVTATFHTAVTSFGILYVHEYAGISTNAPVDVTVLASGSSGSLNSGTATTSSANDLIFGAGASDNMVSAAGSGFTSRDIAYGNITEDKAAGSIGPYSVTATQTGNSWAMQMVAFRAAQ